MFSIVPHARMDVLSGFYAQGVKVEVVVQEDLQIKAAGDDVKGVWVLDRFNQAAAELGVTDFVVPLEEGGGQLCLLSLAWMSMCRRLHRRTWIG